MGWWKLLEGTRLSRARRWGLQAGLGGGSGEGRLGSSPGCGSLAVEGLEWEAEMLRARWGGCGGAPALLWALNKRPSSHGNSLPAPLSREEAKGLVGKTPSRGCAETLGSPTVRS